MAVGIMATDSNGMRLINIYIMGIRGNGNGPAGMTFNGTPDLQLINNSISAMTQNEMFIPMQSVTQPALCRGSTVSPCGGIGMPLFAGVDEAISIGVAREYVPGCWVRGLTALRGSAEDGAGVVRGDATAAMAVEPL